MHISLTKPDCFHGIPIRHTKKSLVPWMFLSGFVFHPSWGVDMWLDRLKEGLPQSYEVLMGLANHVKGSHQ